jgi:DNA polymerase-1
MNKSFVLIDSYAHIYRGFYALPPLNNSAGQPTNAIFAFAKILLLLDRDYPAEYGAAVFDKGKSAHRIKIEPSYKATRPPMPDELLSQIPYVKKITEAFGWALSESEGYEADDIIAAICAKFADARIRIASHDKDLAQLVKENVSLLIPDKKRGGFDVLDENAVFAKFAVRPEQIVDYLALVGDSSDNIPGVEGVGPKTAAKLIRKFSSIDRILAELNSVEREKIRNAISLSRERLAKNRELIKLIIDIPVVNGAEENSFLRKKPNYPALEAICEELELRSIAAEIRKNTSCRQEKMEVSENKPYTPDLF